jgi:type VI protein secretion system component VasK
VDEDIEALDERTEDNRKDVEHILDSLKALEERVANSTAASAPVSTSAITSLRQEIEAALRQKLKPALHQELEAALRQQLEAALRQQLEATLRKELEAALRQEMHSGLRQEIEAGLRKELSGGLRKEVEAVLQARDLASKGDLARGLKTIPIGPSKEEVGQMIEFATRNFLRTVQGTGIQLKQFCKFGRFLS